MPQLKRIDLPRAGRKSQFPVEFLEEVHNELIRQEPGAIVVREDFDTSSSARGYLQRFKEQYLQKYPEDVFKGHVVQVGSKYTAAVSYKEPETGDFPRVTGN